jgi:hypothetical protein
MSVKDGGPAFPCEQGHGPDGTWNQTFDSGMTLRDYFARQAYEVADAMLAVREEGR